MVLNGRKKRFKVKRSIKFVWGRAPYQMSLQLGYRHVCGWSLHGGLCMNRCVWQSQMAHCIQIHAEQSSNQKGNNMAWDDVACVIKTSPSHRYLKLVASSELEGSGLFLDVKGFAVLQLSTNWWLPLITQHANQSRRKKRDYSNTIWRLVAMTMNFRDGSN